MSTHHPFEVTLECLDARYFQTALYLTSAASLLRSEVLNPGKDCMGLI